MKTRNAMREINGKDLTDELTRKRFVCAHCGSTWIEPVDPIVANEDGRREGLLLRIDVESEICQVCWLQPRDCQMCWLQVKECQKCGSKDVYEVRSAEEVSKVICQSSSEEG